MLRALLRKSSQLKERRITQREPFVLGKLICLTENILKELFSEKLYTAETAEGETLRNFETNCYN